MQSPNGDIPTEFRLESYLYDLPEDRIAQQPLAQRDASRLLVLNREDGGTTEAGFGDIVRFLPDNALVVANNSKVVPARMFGRKPSGGQVEILLLTPLSLIRSRAGEQGASSGRVECLLRSSKPVKPGCEVRVGSDLWFVPDRMEGYGRHHGTLHWRGELESLLSEHGHMPLPPYIKRPDTADDQTRYQTVYARGDRAGSVAAPTAGLHFTGELKRDMLSRGMEWREITLFVGYGTFSPVRAEDVRGHAMHGEWVEIPEETAEAVRRAREQGRPVVAVGTTTVRALEGAHAALGRMGAFTGEIDIYIRPGFAFQVVDSMVTNFHLPGSSLIIMVSAFAGRERVLAAYARALERGFRFFSYGDAMLIV